MFNVMIGKYFQVDSKIHKMNSKSKIICVILFLILLSISNNNLIFLGLLTGLTMISMNLSNVPLKWYLKDISNLKWLILFLVVFNLIFNVPLLITLVLITKLILGIIYTMVLTYTTSSTEITYGLEQILKPLRLIKIPVNKIALSISLALRFIPIIFDQTEKILKSQASRGIDFNHSNIKGRIISLSSMLLPMIMLSFKRADALADAMEVRLYNYSNERTNYRINKWNYYDDMMVMLHIFLLALFIIKEIM
jgi:energy-coupling factor transport system permease protein